MQKVVCYVDGFNLYHGLRSKGWKKRYWLDLWALANRYLLSNQKLTKLMYCTARVKQDVEGLTRQLAYIDALSVHCERIQVVYGNYLVKKVRCPNCWAKRFQHEEKMTDVNIACHLLRDAMQKKFDVALLISGDSDLVPPIKMIRELFPEKKIITLFPPNRDSKELKKNSNGYKKIAEIDLRQSQLPDKVNIGGGKFIERPVNWQ